jgi:hypothetical protein
MSHKKQDILLSTCNYPINDLHVTEIQILNRRAGRKFELHRRPLTNLKNLLHISEAGSEAEKQRIYRQTGIQQDFSM